jgi:segregation and condensation protein A
MSELDLEVAGEFLVIAATLIQIKSRSLLPTDAELLADEEEIDAALSTRQLIRRLIEFRKFKELADRLRTLEEENRGVFYRANVIPVLSGSEEEIPSQDIRLLFDAFVRVLRTARIQPAHTVRRQQFHVEDKLVELRERVRRSERINLREVFERSICKEEIIVTFLAVLEMAKLREVTIAQSKPFEDIFLAPWDDSVVYIG